VITGGFILELCLIHTYTPPKGTYTVQGTIPIMKPDLAPNNYSISMTPFCLAALSSMIQAM